MAVLCAMRNSQLEKRRLASYWRKPAEHLEERVLGQVLGKRRILHQPGDQVVDGPLEAPDQRGARIAGACARSDGQIGVAERCRVIVVGPVGKGRSSKGHGDRRSREAEVPEVQNAKCEVQSPYFALCICTSTTMRSTTIATPMPPPTHNDATP